MKPRSLKPVWLPLSLLIAICTLALVSWGHKQSPDQLQQSSPRTDTVPQKKSGDREKKVRDLDEALEELDRIDFDITLERAMKDVSEAMKKIDMDKIKVDIDKAMKEVDMEKIKLEMDKAMKGVDMDKIKVDIERSMKEVDMDKIKLDIDKAMKEVDMEKIKREVGEAVAKVDWDKIKLEIDEAKKVNMDEIAVEMKKVQEELRNIKPQIEKELNNAKIEVEKTKKDLKEYKDFVDGLDRDGLINKKESYTIQHKNGELIVNGKKAADQVYAKYRTFLDKHKSFSIEKNEDDFDIDMD